MNSIPYTNKISSKIEDFNPNRSGIYFSLLLHMIILLFAIGLPDFFKPKSVVLPNIIPIEILNIADTTSITEKVVKENNQPVEKKIIEQKKFNASENVEIKKLEIQEKPDIIKKNIPNVPLKKELLIVPKKEMVIKEKIIKNIEQEKVELIKNVENLNNLKIQPKLKPKLKKVSLNNINTDVEISSKLQPKLNNKNTDVEISSKLQPKLNNKNTDVEISSKLQPKPDPDMTLASIKKDLRNEKSVISNQNKEAKEGKNLNKIEDEKEIESDDSQLRITIGQAIVQQIHKCWYVNSGTLQEDSMAGQYITAEAKYKVSGQVIQNSVQIIDTNINENSILISGVKYALYNCKLNLPEEHHDLWKLITITFDHDNMRDQMIETKNKKLNLFN